MESQPRLLDQMREVHRMARSLLCSCCTALFYSNHSHILQILSGQNARVATPRSLLATKSTPYSPGSRIRRIGNSKAFLWTYRKFKSLFMDTANIASVFLCSTLV